MKSPLGSIKSPVTSRTVRVWAWLPRGSRWTLWQWVSNSGQMPCGRSPGGSRWETFPNPTPSRSWTDQAFPHPALKAKGWAWVFHHQLQIQFQGDKDLGQGRFITAVAEVARPGGQWESLVPPGAPCLKGVRVQQGQHNFLTKLVLNPDFTMAVARHLCWG